MRRILVGYVALLLIPLIGSGALLFRATVKGLVREQDARQGYMLRQYLMRVEVDVEKVESIYKQIQQQNNFVRYASGKYERVVDQLVHYVEEFETMFRYAMASSPYIERITVYIGENDALLELGDHIKLTSSLGVMLAEPGIKRGTWHYDPSTRHFIYRCAIRSTDYSSDIALLEIACSERIVTGLISPLAENSRSVVYVDIDGATYRLDGETLAPLSPLPVTMGERQSAELTNMALMVSVTEPNGVFELLGGANADTALRIVLAALTVLLLSAIYFVMAYKFSRRLSRFSEYIDRSGGACAYLDTGTDELSGLVEAYNRMIDKNDILSNQIRKEQFQAREASYMALQSQIDPHFIYNALEGIRMRAEMHELDDVSDMIYALSRMMRYAFSVKAQKVHITEELDYTEKYLMIQKMRMGERLEYRFDGLTDIDVTCPRFILQPLVENCIAHGLPDSSRALTVSVRGGMDGEWTWIEIEDDGTGMEDGLLAEINARLEANQPLSGIARGSGIGLQNVNERMRYLYGDGFELKLYGDAGVRVLMRFKPRREADACGS